jgi:TonB family protein
MPCADINLAATFLIAAAALCSAQPNLDPRAVLEEIASAERAARTWNAEGVETGELTGEGMNLHTGIRFKAAFRDPTHVRWETTGDNRTLLVCDGADHWTYAEPGTGFYRSPIFSSGSEASPCRSQLPSFGGLLDNLLSVTLAGTDHIPFEGVPTNCEILHAEYWIPAAHGAGVTAGTTIIRTACVDRARKLILRDHTESWTTGSNTRSTRTLAFISYKRDVEIPDEAFKFDVPTGTFLDPGPQLDERNSGPVDGIYHVGGSVSRPQLFQMVEPSSTDEARQSAISGLVLVSLVVDTDGSPRDLAVTRGLGHGLDEKALDVVRQWRFRPGLKDGVPVVVGGLTVAVDFHL